MIDYLDDEALLRLLSAVVLQWWRDCDNGDDLHRLAEFLGVPVDDVIGGRPRRIDGWRRKALQALQTQERSDEDVYP